MRTGGAVSVSHTSAGWRDDGAPAVEFVHHDDEVTALVEVAGDRVRWAAEAATAGHDTSSF